MNINFIIDFDSTFIKVESLDELSKIVLKNNPNKSKIVANIKKITKQGMEGKIDFPTSLQKRLLLFNPTMKDIEILRKNLEKQISKSIIRNKHFFVENSKNIYVISGGFEEYIVPILKDFGIKKNHVLANKFIYNKKQKVIGFDKKMLLSKEKGKVKAVRKLDLKGTTYIIGDGYTDYEIKKEGLAYKFIAFTENIKRKNVIDVADEKISSFDEFLFMLNMPRAFSYPKSKMKVLLLENIEQKTVATFRNEGYAVDFLKTALSEDDLLKKIEDVSILGIRSKTDVTEKVFKKAKKLLAIGAFCIGTNQIDLQVALNQGVAVFNAPYSNTRSVVEMVIAEIILLYRQLFEKSLNAHKGIWDKSAKNSHEVRGKTLGIVGYGNIGTQLSVVAETLGMDVVFYDIQEKLTLGNAKKCSSLNELLKISDVVTIHVDGAKSNSNLIGKNEFALMKKNALFINASRGHVVDISALEQVLGSGRIAGAAIDVFPEEPRGNNDSFFSPLQQISNVILTPHIGGSTIEAQRNIGEFVGKKLMQFIDNGSTMLSVNFPELQLPDYPNAHRLIHIHKNIPGVLSKINTVLAKGNVNILGQYLKTKNEIGYVISDVNTGYNKEIIKKLSEIKGTIKLRVLY